MKAIVIYYSKFGHTKTLAEVMAARLAMQGEARAVSIDQLTPADLAGAGLVVMGSPTDRMRLLEPVGPVLDALPRDILRGARVAAFDTSYRMNALLAHLTAAKTLQRKLRRLGGKPALPPETFFMAAREGPLEDGETGRATAWAAALVGDKGREATA